MQDRRRQFDEILLRRTAGPYMRVKSRRTRLSTIDLLRSLKRISPGHKIKMLYDEL
jgi:hypothetical protein